MIFLKYSKSFPINFEMINRVIENTTNSNSGCLFQNIHENIKLKLTLSVAERLSKLKEAMQKIV